MRCSFLLKRRGFGALGFPAFYRMYPDVVGGIVSQAVRIGARALGLILRTLHLHSANILLTIHPLTPTSAHGSDTGPRNA